MRWIRRRPRSRATGAAIADDPKLLEPHVALGLMLAREGHLPEARTELAAATKVETPDSPVTNPLKARAYRALARIDQKARPGEARDELLEALKRSPESSEDTMLAAELAQSASNGAPAAEAEYRRLLAEHPGDPEATAALAHLLTADKRAPEAESLLEAGLAAHPDDPTLTAQLAALYTSESKTEKALPLVQKLQKNNPQNTDIADMLASLYLKAGDYAQAEPILAELSSRRPQDTTLVMDRADALIRLKRYADAQRILTRIVAEPRLFQKPEDLASAAGALAFAASENNDPQGSLQAITVRGTVSSPSATILFLAAIAHDKLNQVKLAEQAYEQFLAAANGTLPDQEFEAKHRLVALEHRK